MGFLKVVIISSTVVALLAFYARPNFPETANSRGIKTVNGLALKVFHLVSYIGGLMGFSSVTILRTMYSLPSYMFESAPDVKEENVIVDGIRAMVFRPAKETKEPRPGIIHIHGGGWTVLSPAGFANVARQLVRLTQSVLVSIDYRLSPEHIFPVPFEDCLKATRYILNNPEEFNIDGEKITINGDSAGGNLALAVALNISADPKPPKHDLKLVAVVYGALQAFDFNLPSYQKHSEGPGMLTKRLMIEFYLNYAFGHQDYYNMFSANDHLTKDMRNSELQKRVSKELIPDEFKKDFKETAESNSRLKGSEVTEHIRNVVTNPMFSPLLASDEALSKLPATYILTTEFDVLRDDNIILAERLKRLGVLVEHSYHPGEEHTFFNTVDIDENAKEEYRKFTRFFNNVLGLKTLND